MFWGFVSVPVVMLCVVEADVDSVAEVLEEVVVAVSLATLEDADDPVSVFAPACEEPDAPVVVDAPALVVFSAAAAEELDETAGSVLADAEVVAVASWDCASSA